MIKADHNGKEHVVGVSTNHIKAFIPDLNPLGGLLVESLQINLENDVLALTNPILISNSDLYFIGVTTKNPLATETKTIYKIDVLLETSVVFNSIRES